MSSSLFLVTLGTYHMSSLAEAISDIFNLGVMTRLLSLCCLASLFVECIFEKSQAEARDYSLWDVKFWYLYDNKLYGTIILMVRIYWKIGSKLRS